MIIACPACDTRYAVPDTAIGAEGRTVRCAKCKHSWFQEPAETTATPVAAPEPAPAPPVDDAPAQAPAAEASSPPASAAQPSQSSAAAEPSISHWRTEDVPQPAMQARTTPEQRPSGERLDAASARNPAPEPASEIEDEAAAAAALRALRRGRNQPPVQSVPDNETGMVAAAVYDDTEPADDEEYSQFGYSAPFKRRRNTAKMWSIAAALFAVLALGTAAAVNYYGLPEWLPLERPTFGMAKPGLDLDFPPEQNRAETLDSGETIFRVRGTINNAARETIAVPNLLVVFRDERERPVANWIVTPSKRELAPGERLNVTEAIADIPAAAEFAEIGWAPR